MFVTIVAFSLAIAVIQPCLQDSEKSDETQMVETQSYKGKTITYSARTAALDEHSTWDGKSDLNVRMEDVLKKADSFAAGSFFLGIGGISTNVNRVELVRLEGDHWIWIGNATIRESGTKRKLVDVKVPFHLDLTPMRRRQITTR